MSIKVVNKRCHKTTHNDVYIGRGSPLGNPYSHMEGTKALYKVATREEAIACYIPWLKRAMMNDHVVASAMDAITDFAVDGRDINLVCFCSPDSCHGDIIKKIIEYRVERILNRK